MKKINIILNKIFNFINKITINSTNNLIIRQNTTDKDVFKDIFIARELLLPFKLKNVKLIIDAGAYTGISSVYLQKKYPNSKIIAIEPEQSNFKILKKNTNCFSKIRAINAGLWYKKCYLKILNRQTGKWGFKTIETNNKKEATKSITITEILKEEKYNKVDILKIDIEGAEKELFSKNYKDWIKKVRVLIIELHDRINDGCTETLNQALNLDRWSIFKKGEKIILLNKKSKGVERNIIQKIKYFLSSKICSLFKQGKKPISFYDDHYTT